ncbi:MAG: hypothetical protein SO355_00305 [Candidatus Faecousia sp.]|nr:hypothetical protein [Candidatus Faecousia sp.]
MKLKKACYDPAFCRMGLKRFSPVSILYTLVLVLLTLANVNLGADMHGTAVMALQNFCQITLVLQFGYAFILVQLLLGDLYNPRLCFAIHSLPVTRGGWFGTQVIQGILSVIPGILISAGMMAVSVTRFRFLIPLWMGTTLLQFLFFFGLALLCGVGAGNRMGMAVLYGLANFFGLVISWARLKIFAPLIYGMYIPDTKIILCPLSRMLYSELFRAEYSQIFTRNLEDGPMAFFGSEEISQVELVPVSIWTNVFFAALGILAIFFAMKLLNRRKPECAGDLLAFHVTEPVVLVLCTFCSGVVFHAVSGIFGWNLSYLMLALGLVLGYYLCLMLLKRRVNVFTGKSFLPLAAMCALVLLALGITGLDLFGITYRMPETEQVESVRLRLPIGYHDAFTATETADIENILTLQRDALEEHRQREAARPLLERIFGSEDEDIEFDKDDGSFERAGRMYITYTLKNGSVFSRCYLYHETSPHLEILQNIYSRPEFVFSDFGFDVFSQEDVYGLLETTQLVQLNCWHESGDIAGYSQSKTINISREDWKALLDALLEDSKAGKLSQSYTLHDVWCYADSINFIYPSSYFDGMDCLTVDVFGDSENTLNWLIEHGYHDEITE